MVKTEEEIWKLLEEVPDPEVPVISILDLGIVRKVTIIDPESVDVTITPTYSGCPAMNAISIGIRMKLLAHGVKKINIHNQISPAWTTDWLSDTGKVKLREYGIAPPVNNPSDSTAPFSKGDSVACPQCNSINTTLISQFGSTACKALYKCNDCFEPFDYFKCHR